MNKQKAMQAISDLLAAVGEDGNREGLLGTPERVARMYEELLSGYRESAKTHLSKTFHVETSNLVIEKDISFSSMCEHHLMPFFGRISIAYLPDGEVVGLSKLARTVEVFARRLQLQEQLTAQIADAIMEYLKPKGVLVTCEAEHTCMTCRGVNKPGSATFTYCKRGDIDEAFVLELLR